MFSTLNKENIDGEMEARSKFEPILFILIADILRKKIGYEMSTNEPIFLKCMQHLFNT